MRLLSPTPQTERAKQNDSSQSDCRLEPKWLEPKWLEPKWLRIYIYVCIYIYIYIFIYLLIYIYIYLSRLLPAPAPGARRATSARSPRNTKSVHVQPPHTCVSLMLCRSSSVMPTFAKLPLSLTSPRPSARCRSAAASYYHYY